MWIRKIGRAVYHSLPLSLRRRVSGWLQRWITIPSLRRAFSRLSRQEAFSRIYDQNLWGGSPGQFCSGSGSAPLYAEPYCEFIRQFMVRHRIKSILDVGCGDFQVGSRLLMPGVTYLGVDIVPSVIQHNQLHHASESVRFECLDIVENPLPEADLCLVRQVLQHLSNQEIARILPKLAAFKSVVVTEHYPRAQDQRRPNRDKPHGPDTRLLDGSAVYLDQPPFNVRNVLEVLESHMPDGSSIRTFVIDNRSH